MKSAGAGRWLKTKPAAIPALRCTDLLGHMVGQKIIDLIIKGTLCHAKCAQDESHGCVVVWSSGADEQLDAIAAEARSDRERDLEDLLRAAHCIALRKGEGTAWERFAASIKEMGIGSVTARTYRVLPDEVS